MHQHTALAIHTLAELRILLREMHRRNPCTQKICAERQHHLGLVDVEARHFHAIRFLVGGAQYGRADRFVHEMIFATETVQIITQQHLEVTAHAAGQERNLFAAHAVHLLGDQRIGFFPSNGFALISLAQQRLAHAIRIVVMLHPCLTQATGLAAIDCRSGITFNLEHAPFAYASGDIATRIALRASRIEIHADTGDHVVVRFHIRNDRFLAILD